MPGWWNRVEKALDLVAGVTTQRAAGGESPPENAARGLLGSFEAKMTGILVSALHEAFNRDAARLAAEREQAEHERRRAELALQLEMARQRAEREAARLREVGALALIVWLASLLFVTVHPLEGTAGRIILGLAWGCLTAALAAVFAGYRRVRDAAQRVPASLDEPEPRSPRFAAAEAASWLAVGGLALAATSVLVSM